MVLNLAPIGCYPAFLVELPHGASDIDSFGCMISYNNAVVEYNSMLQKAMKQIRKELPKAEVIYVDIHTVMLELFQHPTSHGMTLRPFQTHLVHNTERERSEYAIWHVRVQCMSDITLHP